MQTYFRLSLGRKYVCVSRLYSNYWSLERDTLSLAKGKICADENKMEALATFGRFATLIGRNILFTLLCDDHI